MFGFFKKKDGEKHRRILDKVIMGAVIGGAIGSIVGAAIAPKKEKQPSLFQPRKEKFLVRLLKKILRIKKREPSSIREIPNEMEAVEHERHL